LEAAGQRKHDKSERIPHAMIHHVSSAEDKQELSMIVSLRRTSVHMVLHV